MDAPLNTRRKKCIKWELIASPLGKLLNIQPTALFSLIIAWVQADNTIPIFEHIHKTSSFMEDYGFMCPIYSI